jgi:hypothetical protein
VEIAGIGVLFAIIHLRHCRRVDDGIRSKIPYNTGNFLGLGGIHALVKKPTLVHSRGQMAYWETGRTPAGGQNPHRGMLSKRDYQLLPQESIGAGDEDFG